VEFKVVNDIESLLDSQYFFNQLAYIKHHNIQDEVIVFQLLNNGIVITQVYCYINDYIAKSPYRAPFGGIEVLGGVKKEDLVYFWNKIKQSFFGKGVMKCTLAMPPQCMLREESLFDFLGELATEIIIDKTYYCLPQKGLKLNETKRNTLVKLKKEEFIGVKMIEPIEITLAYRLLKKRYDEMAYPLTMTCDELVLAFESFPDKYHLFSLLDKNKSLAAVMFVVDVNSEIQYIMYNASAKEYAQQSPLVLLYDYVAKEAKASGVKLIDYGIATVKGELNHGLAFFKQSVGGISSDKKTYHFDWSN